MLTMAILAVAVLIALRIARGVFRWAVRLLLVLVVLPVAIIGTVWWQAHAFTSEVLAQLHPGMTYGQARSAVQALDAKENHHILMVPMDLSDAKEWKLVRPIGFFRARVYVAFDHGKIKSLQPEVTFD